MKIVWSIAGSDSAGCAGIQADIKTFNALGVHGCTVITAVTAQNQKSLTDIQFMDIQAQIETLKQGFYPHAIKIGMLGDRTVIQQSRTFLKEYSGKVILDPVLITSSGGSLFKMTPEEYITEVKSLFPYVDLLTPNLPETEMLLNCKITTHAQIEQAAHALINLGIKNVLIKGGHFSQDAFSQDYWTDGKNSAWIGNVRHAIGSVSGTGCTLSSAIASACALDHSIIDAIILGKIYINQCFEHANLENKILGHKPFTAHPSYVPILSEKPIKSLAFMFQDCGKIPLGLYPIVDNLEHLKLFLSAGVTTIQLRIKIKNTAIIKAAIKLSEQYQARLFINDHWQEAIAYGAYGIHLGQEDLATADIEKIRASGCRLGISTHNFLEFTRAHSLQPSYIACGPVFATQTKQVNHPTLGIEKLKQFKNFSRYPIIAIGGIDEHNLVDILSTQVDGVALISALTKANNPFEKTQSLLEKMQ